MQYRKLGRTDLHVSEVGLGCEHLQGLDITVIRQVIDQALASGINILDIFMSEPEVRTNIGRVLAGRRDKVILQGHIGAAWVDGQYLRSRDLAQCRSFFEDFMTRLQTGMVDIGMLHFVDSEEDYDQVFKGGLIEYALQLKAAGTIRAVGMSSHNPLIARRAVLTGQIDVLMFSINPAYDILPGDRTVDDLFTPDTYLDDRLQGIDPARADLYKTCEIMGTGITVMKSLAAGTLLRSESSPFGRALSVVQCMHYALNRPAVASVLVGCRSAAEVLAAADYEQATGNERDYSLVLSQTPKFSLQGHCMYCNHCLPCPAEIDIAQVNKYLDLALASQVESGSSKIPDILRAHYQALGRHAGDCLACGSCEQACPFGVPVIERMQLAQNLLDGPG